MIRTLGGILPRRRDRRPHPARLADAAPGLSADDVPQRAARHPHRDRPPRGRQDDAGHCRDRRRRRPPDRSIAALNFALAAARDGARVLMIDADHQAHTLSNKVSRLGKSEPSRLGWLSIGSKACARRSRRRTASRSCRPSEQRRRKAADAIRKAIAQARAAGGYDLVILDGPAMPLGAADRKLLDEADALVAVLPVSLDINDGMEEIIAALGRRQRKLAGVILNELSPPPSVARQRGRAICLSAAQNPARARRDRRRSPHHARRPAARRARSRADREFHDRDGRSRIAGSAVRCI